MTSEGRGGLLDARAAAPFGLSAVKAVPNKPVLPTATTWLDENPSGPLRRQTGEPFDPRATAQRASKSKTWATFNGQRATCDGPRATSSGLRPMGDGRLCEATSNGRRATEAASDEQRTAGAVMGVDSLGSNKPVLPTATTWLDENPSGPLRRQTGRPFGSRRGYLAGVNS